MSAPERAVARIDLGAIERNCARLRGLLSEGAELCAVVKADGYGHGAVWSAKAALQGGASWLAVATAAEAEDLRRHGIAGRVLVMGALTHDELRTAVEADADVVAWREGFARAVAEHALAGARPPRVHVKLDSGMGRLGTADADEARAVAELVADDERLELAGVMTHFATADEPGDDHFPAQLERFAPFARELKARHPGLVVHAANSAAAFRDADSHFDMVRCGIAIYGLDPFQADPTDRGLEPALSLESWVAAVKRFEPGDSAGYGRTWRADDATWVATVPIGYGDGWRRALSNDCDVLVGGVRRPVVGTISMDNLTVDLGHDTDVEVGAPCVMIGEQGGERILCEEVARRLETINYEVTCGLTPRVRRLHLR
ncbi:MAG TPA: alanine racemase [Thermoleophilaceae bacterium]|nr:alanine racemase [Thermoleophilaceae bacterium]